MNLDLWCNTVVFIGSGTQSALACAASVAGVFLWTSLGFQCLVLFRDTSAYGQEKSGRELPTLESMGDHSTNFATAPPPFRRRDRLRNVSGYMAFTC